MMLCAGILIWSGCSKVEQAKEAVQNIESLEKSAAQAQNNQELIAKKREERIARGDTMALGREALIAFLPAIEGYDTVNTEFAAFNMPGTAYSQIVRHYKAHNDEAATLELTLADYSGAYGMMDGLTALWSFSVENDQEKAKGFDPGFPLSGGWEVYNKVNKQATVFYALGGRFLLTLKAEKQTDTELAKKIASSMKLKDLAAK
jgi:soluble cytochrome b562